MNTKKIYSKLLITLSSTLLLIIYMFMFFTYKNSVISSAILRSSIAAETLSSNSLPFSSMIERSNNLDSNNINEFDIGSSTPHLILVNTTKQRAYIFKGTTNNWILEKNFVCSTGLPVTETPKGLFTCGFKDDCIFSQKFNKASKYYTHIIDCYYLHLTPFYVAQNTLAEEVLGKSDFHGCIKLSIDDSKWIYNNVDDDSTIIIY